MLKRSPLAPERFPDMPAVAGVTLAAMHCGLKKDGALDLLFAALAPGTTVAGVLTRSATGSAPVRWCRRNLKRGRARALVVNSGNANAFTGAAGERTVDHTARAAAKLLDCKPQEVFLASTGVIGVPIGADKVAPQLPALAKRLRPGGWPDAAAAISTTDTFQKGALRRARIGEAEVTLAGVAKGSGMIAPDMATMLAFLFTDAKIPAAVLQRLLGGAADRSFNAVTVDSDTSTSDTVLLFATGQGPKHKPVRAAGDRHVADFAAALDDLCIDLAVQLARDGEGAQKLVTIDVSGAASAKAARRIGLAIANSPLVKTAIAGADANWGRIVMAVGKAGERIDAERLAISVGGVPITDRDGPRPDYDEAPVTAHMQGRDIRIAVDVGVGRGKARVWTCDLTHGYIDINADYRS